MTKICKSASYCDKPMVRKHLKEQDLVFTGNDRVVQLLEQIWQEKQDDWMREHGDNFEFHARVVWIAHHSDMPDEIVIGIAKALGFKGPFEITGFSQVFAMADHPEKIPPPRIVQDPDELIDPVPLSPQVVVGVDDGAGGAERDVFRSDQLAAGWHGGTMRFLGRGIQPQSGNQGARPSSGAPWSRRCSS